MLIERLKERKVRPATPGDLLADLIESNHLTQTEVAARTGVARATINRIVQGRRAITPDLAQRLGRFFSNGPAIWLNFQKQVDLWDALHASSAPYRFIKPLSHSAISHK
jgi:addiction module HigA family antidote